MSNKTHDLLTKDLKDLTYDDIESIKKYMRSNDFTVHYNKLQQDKWVEDRVQADKNRVIREKAKEKAADLNKYVVAFVDENVESGDFVGFHGTRSYPLRRVVEIVHGNIRGLIISRLGEQDKVTGKFDPKFTGYMSTDGIDRMRSWFDPKHNRWVKRPEMIEIGKKLLGEIDEQIPTT